MSSGPSIVEIASLILNGVVAIPVLILASKWGGVVERLRNIQTRLDQINGKVTRHDTQIAAIMERHATVDRKG